ncbi:DUF4175 family protein [Mucilaginibacter aquaedulcis]|uniref:DUF4175 family protein n=1 Tax=Mucilaginibacter aquaedulcis TaxID=1187081 RepID=UPI0025B57B90|nr:DUF4175 family protein [Mucilaginibacter aquaedulcis]MDN3547677.1 hypothetical protein [Mucilaginibacter aquaedulcis]
MTKHSGAYKIRSILSWYIGYRVAADVLFAAAFAILIASIFSFFTVFGLLIFLVALTLLMIWHRVWQVSELAISTYLNRHYIQLEESGHLFIKPEGELNFLEHLQLSKIEPELSLIPVQQKQFMKPFFWGVAALLLAVFLSGHLMGIGSNGILTHYKTNFTKANTKPGVVEKVLPQISAVGVTITPPSYTGKAAHQQDKFSILIEEGGMIAWKITTNIAVKQVSILFNDKETIALKSLNNEQTSWKAQKQITRPGFYQVSIDGKLSDLYQVQIIKDLPPVIRIKTPKQYTYIDAGEAPKVNIEAAVNDDYGVSKAQLIATVAKGSGEAVKFKEYKLDFAASFNRHQAQYNLQKLIKLSALNMEPGDELYFYIQAIDTHQQQSRTDVYTVSIQDTAQLLSMDGVLSGVNQKPEFFRSERQIILDSEKLLKEKDSISVEQFKSRSNDLGTDQKLLRLRYGKFLGEESESDIGGDENDAVSDVKNYGNAAVILDKYTDKHDNAEDAGFFDPELKAQLKATLTEMWRAELQLRLYKPQDALPFEYKALRLLKDLQQKSRIYVAKTSYNAPPLKLDKRLSGDLSKINQQVNQQDIKPAKDGQADLKKAVIILQHLKLSADLNDQDRYTLTSANQQLSVKASAEPGVYLTALSAMRRIMSAKNKVQAQDISVVEKAIQKTLVSAKKTPFATQNPADMGLSQEYFKNLNHLNR